MFGKTSLSTDLPPNLAKELKNKISWEILFGKMTAFAIFEWDSKKELRNAFFIGHSPKSTEILAVHRWKAFKALEAPRFRLDSLAAGYYRLLASFDVTKSTGVC